MPFVGSQRYFFYKCRAVRRKELGKVTADVILSYPTGLIVSFDFGVEAKDVTDHIDVIDGQVLLLALSASHVSHTVVCCRFCSMESHEAP